MSCLSSLPPPATICLPPPLSGLPSAFCSADCLNSVCHRFEVRQGAGLPPTFLVLVIAAGHYALQVHERSALLTGASKAWLLGLVRYKPSLRCSHNWPRLKTANRRAQPTDFRGPSHARQQQSARKKRVGVRSQRATFQYLVYSDSSTVGRGC